MSPTAEKRYIETIGRRKTSAARVRVTPSSRDHFSVNEKEVAVYFPTAELQRIVHEAIQRGKTAEKFSITVRVKGGGIHSQAEAVRHGIARVFAGQDKELRTILKKQGFLKRDPRAKERRKFGLKKARKSPQWSKR